MIIHEILIPCIVQFIRRSVIYLKSIDNHIDIFDLNQSGAITFHNRPSFITLFKSFVYQSHQPAFSILKRCTHFQ